MLCIHQLLSTPLNTTTTNHSSQLNSTFGVGRVEWSRERWGSRALLWNLLNLSKIFHVHCDLTVYSFNGFQASLEISWTRRWLITASSIILNMPMTNSAIFPAVGIQYCVRNVCRSHPPSSLRWSSTVLLSRWKQPWLIFLQLSYRSFILLFSIYSWRVLRVFFVACSTSRTVVG